MACRCGDIQVCIRDKNKLSRAMNDARRLQVYGGTIEGNVMCISNTSPEAYNAENMEETCLAIRGLKDSLSTDVDKLAVMLQTKTVQLQNSMAAMQTEDAAYHRAVEEERRRQEELLRQEREMRQMGGGCRRG